LRQASGERLKERLVGARATTTERQLDTMTMRPRTSLLEGELGTSSDLDELWWAAMRSPVSDRSAAMAAHSWIVESASENRRNRSPPPTLMRFHAQALVGGPRHGQKGRQGDDALVAQWRASASRRLGGTALCG
jgi:hypothetical protein